jgi:hypothetical protein
MNNNLQWSSEQRKRAHSRIFEDIMSRHNLTEKQIIAKLGEDGPRAQSTISRWKTLDVIPNRHKYLDLLRNVFHLNYEQIDAMLWLTGTPPLLRQEANEIFGGNQIFREKTESELGLAAYKLLIDTIGTDLGMPSPYWENDESGTNEVDEFTFATETTGEKLMVRDDELPLKLEGWYWPPFVRPRVWVVLQDNHFNYYLQSPPVNFLPDGRWIADNIIPGKGITTVHFVAIGVKGNDAFMKKVRHRDWAAFPDIPQDGRIIKSITILREQI